MYAWHDKEDIYYLVFIHDFYTATNLESVLKYSENYEGMMIIDQGTEYTILAERAKELNQEYLKQKYILNAHV